MFRTIALLVAFTLSLVESNDQDLPLCYASTQSPLEYVPLDMEFNPSLDSKLSKVDVEKMAPYWNLSCPWEWSKFSCIHQDQLTKSILAYEFSSNLNAKGCRLSEFDAEALLKLLGDRTLLFVGDSSSRQMFTSMLCMIESHPSVKVVEDNIKWSNNINCGKYTNCIESGQHSGFVEGNVKFSLNETPNDVLDVRFEYKDDGASLPHVLKEHADLKIHHSIVVANIGSHIPLNKRLYETKYFAAYTEQKKMALPIVIYRESAPQHFQGHPGGVFIKGKSKLGNCEAEIDLDQDYLSKPERTHLKGKMPVISVNPFSGNAGKYHVGIGVDCSHWCAPGVPDLWNVVLFNYINAHLKKLEKVEY